MNDLGAMIARRTVPRDTLALYWLCQAGFAFKDSAGQVTLIDPYFSDVVERVVGFRRLMPCPLAPDEIQPALVLCTHEHLDHMDTDALPRLAKSSPAHFAGPVECIRAFESLGIPSARCHLLEAGETLRFHQLTVTAVYADHGDLAPDAVGIVLDFSGIRVYHTGDTAFRPEEFTEAIAMRPDILLPCINGAFGNMNEVEAAELTRMIAPRLVVPAHFGMFAEQNGDPAAFLAHCRRLAPHVRSVQPDPGQEFLFTKADSKSSSESTSIGQPYAQSDYQ